MNDEQKQALLEKKEAERLDAQAELEAFIARNLAEEQRLKLISEQPWNEIKPEQYADKFITDKTYLWFLLLLVPALLFKFTGSWQNAKRGY